MNAWSHLPNAAHIDRIIASAKAHQETWHAAWRALVDTISCMSRDAAISAAGDAASNADRIAARNAGWWHVRGGAARGSILALIAYDDAAKYLEMSSDQVKIWAELSEEPAAVLLLPAVIAFEQIREMKAA